MEKSFGTFNPSSLMWLRKPIAIMTVTGKTVGENLKDVDYAYNRDVIRPIGKPLSPVGGMCILKGNLAPNGAVIKRSAATERLMHHRGPAKVFDDLSVAEKWLADPNSAVDENTVIVLRGYGPKGAPGMPEFGNYLPVPPKLHKKGIDDYLRVTDSRMLQKPDATWKMSMTIDGSFRLLR